MIMIIIIVLALLVSNATCLIQPHLFYALLIVCVYMYKCAA